MKKLIIIFVFVILFLFVSMWIMVAIDENNINDIENEIINNTELEYITYITKYDGNYIVSDKDYVYVFNSKYEEIDKVKIDLLFDNKEDYAIVYIDEKLMYMNDYIEEEGLVVKYYDIYTYKLVDEILIGGN